MRAARFVGVLLIAAGCASRQNDAARLLQPEIVLRQIPMSQFILQYPGPISIGFELFVRNPSGEPITLRRLELQTVGTGSYYLRRLPNVFKQLIPPNDTAMVTFSAQAYAQGGRTGSREPVMIRGIAYFESPAGNFHRIFTTNVLPTGGD